MSQIFISYASADRAWAKSLADAFKARGWSVWWDHDIPIGEAFDKVIEKQLRQVKCLVVIWSRNSVTSNWVRAEASEGLNRQILAPVSIDGSESPLVFKQIQTANLSGWHGETEYPDFEKLTGRVSQLLNSPEVAAKEGARSKNTTIKPSPKPTDPKNHPKAQHIEIGKKMKITRSTIRDISGINIQSAGDLPRDISGASLNVLEEAEIDDSEVGDISGIKHKQESND